jgi:hypothetical protein
MQTRLCEETDKLELKKKRLVDKMAEGFIGGDDFKSAYDE